MLDLWPIGREVEIRAIGLRVAGHASRRRLHEPVAFLRVFGMDPAWTVTGLALDIRELRR